MPRPGFVLEVDRSTPPILFWRGAALIQAGAGEGSAIADAS